VSTGGTVLDDGEDVTSPRASTAVKPLVALAYHSRYTTDPESVTALPNGEAWLASVERVDENVRHLSVHRGHNLDISNGHCKRNIEMTPLCKIEVTHPRVLGPREMRHGGVVDEQAGVQPA
jgi:5,10-methylenetetrahydromethanopterin reductase